VSGSPIYNFGRQGCRNASRENVGAQFDAARLALIMHNIRCIDISGQCFDHSTTEEKWVGFKNSPPGERPDANVSNRHHFDA
jgi:hypothetical protein